MLIIITVLAVWRRKVSNQSDAQKEKRKEQLIKEAKKLGMEFKDV